MLYAAALVFHSWFRWVVVFTGLAAFVRAASGASGTKSWTPSDDRAGFWFIMALDLQLTVGLVLYFAFNHFAAQIFHDFGGAMKDPHLRFWAVEHGFGMLVGIALAHIGRTRTRKVDSLRRHKVAAIFYGLSLLVILLSIPWPGTPNGRPWVRW